MIQAQSAHGSGIRSERQGIAGTLKDLKPSGSHVEPDLTEPAFPSTRCPGCAAEFFRKPVALGTELRCNTCSIPGELPERDVLKVNQNRCRTIPGRLGLKGCEVCLLHCCCE